MNTTFITKQFSHYALRRIDNTTLQLHQIFQLMPDGNVKLIWRGITDHEHRARLAQITITQKAADASQLILDMLVWQPDKTWKVQARALIQLPRLGTPKKFNRRLDGAAQMLVAEWNDLKGVQKAPSLEALTDAARSSDALTGKVSQLR